MNNPDLLYLNVDIIRYLVCFTSWLGRCASNWDECYYPILKLKIRHYETVTLIRKIKGKLGGVGRGIRQEMTHQTDNSKVLKQQRKNFCIGSTPIPGAPLIISDTIH